MSDYILDIETTTDFNLIRCAVLYQGSGYSSVTLTGEDLEISLGFLTLDDTLIMHNGCRFDIPKIKELWGVDIIAMQEIQGFKIVDTLILSKILVPDRLGGHSLKRYGEDMVALGVIPEGKTEITDPEWYNTCSLSDLVEYCEQDCRVTHNLYNELLTCANDIDFKYSHALRIEQAIAFMTNAQVAKGVCFDIAKASKLVDHITSQMAALESICEAYLPEVPLSPSEIHYPPKVQFKKDGTLSTHIVNYCAKYNCKVIKYKSDEGYFVSSDTGEFVGNLPLRVPLRGTKKVTLSNQKALKDHLMSIGWKPTMWNFKKDSTGKTKRTSPRLTDKVSKEPCPNLRKVAFSVADTVSEWLMLRSRRNLLLSPNGTGLIIEAQKATPKEGYISSDADTVGTPTARYRHRGIVNIPRVSSKYGKEFRELFMAPPGMAQVGWDASSLEACCEAHYTKKFDPVYADSLISGSSEDGTDVHSRNMRLLGLPNRDVAKTFKYAIMYGAKPTKLAESLSVNRGIATRWYNEFWEENVALSKFKGELEREWKFYNKEYLVGLDGRLITTRYQHALLNTKLQSAGGIIMKHAFLIAEKLITKTYPDQAHGVIRYHDEEAWYAKPEIANDVGKLGVKSIKMAGEFLKLNVPLNAEYKVGKNWSETH